MVGVVQTAIVVVVVVVAVVDDDDYLSPNSPNIWPPLIMWKDSCLNHL